MLRSAVLRLQGRIALPALDRLAVSSGVHIPITPTSFAQSTILPNSKPVPLSHYRFFSSSRPNSEQDQGTQSQSIGQIEPKLSLTFTCTVQDCGHRSSHEFTKRSYEKGIVLVQCPGCNNRHLIADHLSWFTENASDPKNIEQIIALKGGKVKRGVNYIDGKGYETMEIFEDTEKA